MTDYTKAELYTLCLGLSALMKEPACCDAHALAVSTLKGKVMLDLIGRFADGPEMDLIPELNHKLGVQLPEAEVTSLVIGGTYVLQHIGEKYHMCRATLLDIYADGNWAKVQLENAFLTGCGTNPLRVPIDCLQEIPQHMDAPLLEIGRHYQINFPSHAFNNSEVTLKKIGVNVVEVDIDDPVLRPSYLIAIQPRYLRDISA